MLQKWYQRNEIFCCSARLIKTYLHPASATSLSSGGFRLGNKKWFSSTYCAPNSPFSAQKYRSVVCSLRLTSNSAGGRMPWVWMYLRAAVTGLSSPLSILNWGICSRILRPSWRRLLFRLRLLAKSIPPNLDPEMRSGLQKHCYYS